MGKSLPVPKFSLSYSDKSLYSLFIYITLQTDSGLVV